MGCDGYRSERVLYTDRDASGGACCGARRDIQSPHENSEAEVQRGPRLGLRKLALDRERRSAFSPIIARIGAKGF